MDELTISPCPFCGSERVCTKNPFVGWPYHVACEDCGATGPDRDSRVEAIESWNRVYYLVIEALEYRELLK